MFGYVKTDIPNMYVKDTVLYKAMYCGLCKGIGSCCGQRARLCLNYDLTFLSVLCHNILNVDVKVEKQRCCIHWLRKRSIANVDDLTKRIAKLNIILAFHKLNDDVIDENKGRIKKFVFKKAYKKAVKTEPVIDEIVTKYYNELLSKEKSGCDSVDIVADSFGKMMQNISKEISGEVFDENLSRLSYSLGKWIYLIDAIDDFDKDKKKNNYNVFLINNENLSKSEYIKNNISDLQMIFGAIISDIIADCDKLSYKFNHDLIDNILKKGILKQTKKVLEEDNEKKL